MPGFELHSVAQYDSSIERESWFRTIPVDEFVDGMPVTTLRFRRPQTSDYSSLGLIEIRQAQFCFRPPDLSAFCFSSFSSHVQPPPKRLDRRMWTSHEKEDGMPVSQTLDRGSMSRLSQYVSHNTVSRFTRHVDQHEHCDRMGAVLVHIT